MYLNTLIYLYSFANQRFRSRSSTSMCLSQEVIFVAIDVAEDPCFPRYEHLPAMNAILDPSWPLLVFNMRSRPERKWHIFRARRELLVCCVSALLVFLLRVSLSCLASGRHAFPQHIARFFFHSGHLAFPSCLSTPDAVLAYAV